MTRGGSQVVRNRPDRRDAESGQVLPFRRPGLPPLLGSAGPTADADGDRPDDLARYEQDRDDVIDYRQRMLMNVIALAIVTLLITAGVWIAGTIADLQRGQDCILQGRSNCAPVELPAPPQQ